MLLSVRMGGFDACWEAEVAVLGILKTRLVTWES